MNEVLEQAKVEEKKSSLKRGQKKNKLQILLIISVAILFVIVLVLGWYIFDVLGGKMEKLETTDLSKDNKQEAQEVLDLSNKDPEAGGVVEKVSKHILLPARDFQVYTVNDASALWKENPVLYQYVLNGSKLVAYDTGIIVYNQELDKIVDVIQFYGEREKKLQSANISAIK